MPPLQQSQARHDALLILISAFLVFPTIVWAPGRPSLPIPTITAGSPVFLQRPSFASPYRGRRPRSTPKVPNIGKYTVAAPFVFSVRNRERVRTVHASFILPFSLSLGLLSMYVGV